MEILILVAIICAVIGAVVNGGIGALLGFFFGPLGLIVAAILSVGNSKDA